jgi:hypothetical protein
MTAGSPLRPVTGLCGRCPGGRFTGTVRVFLLGTSDQDRLLQEVETGKCAGQPERVVSTAGPRASRACLQVVNGKALAGA